MASNLDHVITMHAEKCNCITRPGYGVVVIGRNCQQMRTDYLKDVKIHPGHTRATGGINGKRREQRCVERSKLANGIPL